jgi:hypothetical protein
MSRSAIITLLVTIASAQAIEPPPMWRDSVRRTHAKFTGRPGTLALFGDSITVSLAFWVPLQGEIKGASKELDRAVRRVRTHLKPECWRGWRGSAFGNEGGKTTAWADEHVGEWLKKLNPEAAVILFGTNDLNETSPEDYRGRLRSVVRRCLDNGTIVLLTTVPPRHGFERKSEQFAQVARDVARELQVPLIDYHADIFRRRPKDWDGAADAFRKYEGYDVPTLLARDGVHPSLPKRYEGDYSDEALSRSGYNLRNALTALKYAEVLEALEGEGRSRPTKEKRP